VFSSLPDPEKYPPQYLFLPGREHLAAPAVTEEAPDLFIALDCGNLERLGELRRVAEMARTLVNIDHHEDNRMFAPLNIVDPEASSTSEIVFKLVRSAGWDIGPEAATCLYTGVITDTGRFQHQNTKPETFMVAYRLALEGADVIRVGKEVYESQSLSYTRLLGIALRRVEVVEDCGLVYSYITREDLAETGAALSETEDLIDHLRAVRGTRVAAVFKELEDGRVRVSLRSRDDFQVGPIARALGGGGHATAAGYTSRKELAGSLDELLEALRDAHGRS
jgi:phosphoesterase RecJ-like protein